MNSEKSTYLSMMTLSILAFILGFGVVLDGMLVYNLPWFTSISESATTGPKTGMLLPFVLGAMCIFFIGYRGYDLGDRICAKLMALGAFGVAMQICTSEYLNGFNKVGLLGLDPSKSNIVHSVSAFLLFGTMIYWVGCRFTKGVLDDEPTDMKRWRNRLYRTTALIALVGVIFLPIGSMLGFKEAVFVSEEIILLPLAISIFTKAGGWLKDHK